MLPGIDGYEVIEKIRASNSDTGILILSARDTLEDKLKGFRSGSDDYLPKPFAFEELLARINALLKRREVIVRNTTHLSYSNLILDAEKRKVFRGEREIELTHMEFQLL